MSEEHQKAADDAELYETEDSDGPDAERLDETESSEEEDSEAVEDDESDYEDDQEPTFTLELGGEDVEVALGELKKGYIRQRTFTKKSMALAEERKATEAKVQQLAEVEQTQLAVMQEIFAGYAGQPVPAPDPQLFYSDKPAYEEAMHRHNTWRTQAEQWQQALQNKATQVQQFEQQKFNAKVAEEFPKMLEAWSLPPEQAEAGAARITDLQSSMAKSYGIPPDAFRNVLDHGFYLAFEDARKWRELKKGSDGKAMRKLKRKGIKPIRSGRANVKPKKQSLGDMADKRFGQTAQDYNTGNANLRDVFSEAAAAHAQEYRKR